MAEIRESYAKSLVEHYVADRPGTRNADFSFCESDMHVITKREINFNEQPAQVTVSHPKIPGLSWMIFFYQTAQNQFQPKVAYDFPSYLRSDTELCIRFAGMHWTIKTKFEGSGWATNLPPRVMNERWITVATCRTVEVNINIAKLWFKFPVFSVCCFPIQSQKYCNQPDFTNPNPMSNVQLIPEDQASRRLFAHTHILGLNSPWFAEKFMRVDCQNNGDVGPRVTVPFGYDDVHNYLKYIYPNSDFQFNEENVEGLMDIAREYHTPNIIREAEKFLYQCLEVGSAVIVYNLARRHCLVHLQEAALLHLSELNSSDLKSRINLDMQYKSPETQEILLHDLCGRLATL